MKQDERKFWQIMTVVTMTVRNRLLDSQRLLVVDGKAVLVYIHFSCETRIPNDIIFCMYFL